MEWTDSVMFNATYNAITTLNSKKESKTIILAISLKTVAHLPFCLK